MTSYSLDSSFSLVKADAVSSNAYSIGMGYKLSATGETPALSFSSGNPDVSLNAFKQ